MQQECGALKDRHHHLASCCASAMMLAMIRQWRMREEKSIVLTCSTPKDLLSWKTLLAG